MDIMSQLCVLALLLVIALAFLVMLKRGGDPLPQDPTPSDELPVMYVQQLNPNDGEIVHEFAVNDVPEWGLSISGPEKRGDIVLVYKKSCDYELGFVHTEHALIGHDEEGYFIRDNNTKNKMYIKGNSKPVDVVSIENNLVVYLGMQPIRFVFAKSRSQGHGVTRIMSEESKKPNVLRRH